jgi:hypothetical protein
LLNLKPELNELLQFISATLSDDELSVEIFHRVALDLLREVRPKLESQKAEAFEAAENLFTPALVNEEWNKQLEIIGHDLSMGETPLKRLLWSAINTNTPLDAYAAEFLATTANAAGVPTAIIRAIFIANIPGRFL